jgi:hypothetical protein
MKMSTGPNSPTPEHDFFSSLPPEVREDIKKALKRAAKPHIPSEEAATRAIARPATIVTCGLLAATIGGIVGGGPGSILGGLIGGMLGAEADISGVVRDDDRRNSRTRRIPSKKSVMCTIGRLAMIAMCGLVGASAGCAIVEAPIAATLGAIVGTLGGWLYIISKSKTRQPRNQTSINSSGTKITSGEG